MKHWRLSLFILFSTTTLISVAQERGIDSLTKMFDEYRKQNLQEKIYLHLDRTSFLTGEILWFKIYCVDASFHKPLDISKVAYVEILDNSNKAVLQTKVAMSHGSGSGSLFIPATINSGHFIVRAYTSWMKNSDVSFYYHQPITIINPFKKPEIGSVKDKSTYDAQFLPEGGNVLAGEKNKIAFRVIDQQGHGIEFHGAVIDQHSDTIVSFKPTKFGIGYFIITPNTDEKYRVVIKDLQGKINHYDFPEVFSQGFQLALKESPSEDALNISIKSRVPDAELPFVYLFIHTRNQVVHSQRITTKAGAANVLINKQILGDGISHITLFSASMQPVSERLYFKYPNNKLMIGLQTDQQSYAVRKSVKLTVEAHDENQKPTDANLSISVHKNDSLSFFSQQHLSTYLLLTSDLQGTVESPEYYFSDDPQASISMDNVMLTHGWRRFAWKAILNKEKTNTMFLPEFQGHIIRGKVLDESDKPAVGITTYLSSPSRLIRLYGSTSDKNGGVRYLLKNFTGPRKIILQTNWQRDSTHTLRVENPFSTEYADVVVPPFELSKEINKQLLSRSIAMQVQDVYYDDKVSYVNHPLKDSTAFYGVADETYLLDDFTRFPVMEEVMREYVPGVWVRKHKGKFVFMVLDNPNKGLFKENPMVLIDGVPVFDIDKIMAFDPLKVKKLEVMTKKYYLGKLIFPGLVSYSTYSGDLAGFQPDHRSIILDYEGIQLQREFYSPRYATMQQLQSRLPDQRNLLYWNPEVIMTNGKAELEFYTSDLTGEYVIRVEGISSNGNPGSSQGNFLVKRLSY